MVNVPAIVSAIICFCGAIFSIAVGTRWILRKHVPGKGKAERQGEEAFGIGALVCVAGALLAAMGLLCLLIAIN